MATAHLIDYGPSGWGWAVRDGADTLAESNQVFTDDTAAEAAAADTLGTDWPGSPSTEVAYVVTTEDIEPGVAIEGTFTTDTDNPAVELGDSGSGGVITMHTDDVDKDPATIEASDGATGWIFSAPSNGGDWATPAVVQFIEDAVNQVLILRAGTHVQVEARLTIGPIDSDNYIDIYRLGTGGATPTAPGDGVGRMFVRESAGGKDQLCVRFNSGATQVIATEP